MDILQDFIKALGKEEIKSYKLFTKRTHDFDNRKDIELFDSIKNNNEELDGYHNNLIYNSKKPDTKYYRLKHKITDDLGVVLTNLNHRKPEIDALHLLSLAKVFSIKKQWSLALHYLKLAERRSVEREDYALLESIYEQMIRLSMNDVDSPPINLVDKRNKNTLKLNLLRELENNLAVLSYEVKTTQNLTEHKEMSIWLDETIKNTLKLGYVQDSPQLQIKVFQNLCRLMLLLKDYQSLEIYLKDSLIQFEKNNLFNKETHEIKLQLLVYLCNALCALGDFDQSLEYSKLLNEAIYEYNKLGYFQYMFYYYNIQVTNYFNTNIQKAIPILLEARQDEIIKNNSVNYFYVLSNLTLCYFQTKQHKQASKLFNQMYISDNYKTVDAIFKLKLHLFEVVNRVEMEDFELCEKHLASIEKEVLELEKESIQQELNFIAIINLFLKQKNYRWRPLKKDITDFSNIHTQSSGLVSYAAWLTTKVS